MHDAAYCRIPLRRRDGTIRAYATVDQADAPLAEYAWCLDSRGYAVRNVDTDDGRRTHLLMHRAVLGLSRGDGLDGDHINRDRLDNRRANLRIVTRGQNLQNTSARGGSSPYRGVMWNEATHNWRAKVQIAGRTHHVGLFDDERDAAVAAADYRAKHMPYAVD